MPDLSALGSGISETFFGHLAEQRQVEQEKKDKELARQLAAYHALMEHQDTPINEIPNIMDAQAKLLKAPKEFYKVTEHMRQAIQQHGLVPNGPEQERQIPTPQVHFQLPTQGEDVPIPAPQARLNNPDPSFYLKPQGAPGTEDPGFAMQPAGFVAPRSPAPQTFQDVVPMVPAEPTTVSYQPTKSYGEMSQGEAEDFRKSQSYITQQKAMLDRQSQLAEEVGNRAAERDVARQKAALELQEKRNAGRMAQIDETFAQKKKALGQYDTAAAAAADKQRLALEMQLRAGGMDAQEAKERSGAVLASNMEAILDQHKAKAERDRAEVKHWSNTDSVRLVGKGGAATAGMSAGQARTFRANVVEVLPELNSVRSQLATLKTLRAQANGTQQGTKKPGDDGYDAGYDAPIEALEKQHTDLLVRINDERKKVLASSPNVSRVPGAPSQTPTLEGALDAFRARAKREPTTTEVDNIKKHYGLQ